MDFGIVTFLTDYGIDPFRWDMGGRARFGSLSC